MTEDDGTEDFLLITGTEVGAKDGAVVSITAKELLGVETSDEYDGEGTYTFEIVEKTGDGTTAVVVPPVVVVVPPVLSLSESSIEPLSLLPSLTSSSFSSFFFSSPSFGSSSVAVALTMEVLSNELGATFIACSIAFSCSCLISAWRLVSIPNEMPSDNTIKNKMHINKRRSHFGVCFSHQ